MSCGPSLKEETVRFTNVYSSSTINETVYKMGVFNSGYANKAFAVYNPETGYSKDQIFRYDTNIPKDSEGQTFIRFSPEADSVQSCIDNRETECSLSSTIYIQPYYCNTNTSPPDCHVNDGLEINAQGIAVFALPSISYSSTNFDFGQVEIGQTKTLTLTITNNSSNETFRFKIYEFSHDFGSDQTGETRTVNAGGSQDLNITFTPASTGTQATTTYFTDTRVIIGRIIGLGLAINLSGEGIEPPSAEPEPPEEPVTEPETDTPSATTETTSATEVVETTPNTTTAPTLQTETEQAEATETTPTTPAADAAPVPVWVAKGNEYKVTISAPSIPAKLKESESFVIRGKADPFAKLMLYIYSDPIIVEILADGNGDWTYALPRGIGAGKHEIFAAVIESDDELTEPIKVAEFEVISQAQAAEAAPASKVAAKKELGWVIPALAVMAAALLLTSGYYWMAYRKICRQVTNEGEGTTTDSLN